MIGSGLTVGQLRGDRILPDRPVKEFDQHNQHQADQVQAKTTRGSHNRIEIARAATVIRRSRSVPPDRPSPLFCLRTASIRALREIVR